MALNDFGQRALRAAVGNTTYASPVLAIATTTTAFRTTATVPYTVGGVFGSKASTDNITITAPAGESFYVQPASTTVYYTVGADISGNMRVWQSTFQGQDLSGRPNGGISKGDGAIRMPTDDFTIFGYIKIVTNGSTTFTVGTTALGAAGLTTTYVNCNVLPASDRP